ncbi:MAG TPA: SDR family oxidoreductase [Chitinophagales bacterium]|nr:SDR family oxidoreductase [Chitinophagales bacterium]
MKDKIVLITGGNAGIGKATAVGLAKMGARVIIACRSNERGTRAVEEIKNASNNQNVDLLLIDLESQQSVRNAVADFKNRYQKLHVLINNAGVFLPKREVTEDGIEKTFATNYLGHFLLTLLLLDLLKANAPSRIICVASKHSGIKINFDDLMLEKKYSVFQAVGQTKLGLILFTKELAKRLEETGVTINSLYPGLVKTNLLKDIPWMRIMFALMPRISPEKGASTSIYLASSPDVENVIGKFFSNKKETPTSSNANNESDIKRLWDISMKLTGLQI